MKKLIFIFMVFFCSSGNIILGQKNVQRLILGNNNFNLEVKDFKGYTSPQGIFSADIKAAELKSKFIGSISIVSVIGYPISIFTDESRNVDNFFNNIKTNVNAEFPINILFVSSAIQNSKNYKGRVFITIPENYFAPSCQSKRLEFEQLMTYKFNERCGYISNDEVYNAISYILIDMIEYLDSGCGLSEKEEEELFLFRGYKVFDVSDNSTVQRSLSGLKDAKITNRNTCPLVVDSSRVVIEPSDKTLEEYFFGGTDYLAFSAHYVLTSGFTPIETRVLLESGIESSSCDISVHVHIPNNVYGTPLKKIFLKLRVQNKSPSGWYETYKESLQNKFDLGIYENNNTTEWIFKFKNHKDLITTYLVDDPKYIPSQNAAYIGLICGFADSFLRDMQFLANITILQGGVRETNWLFSNYVMQVILGNASKAEAEYAFRTYIHEMIKSSDVASFGNNFSDVGQAITIFIETIKEALGDQWEKMQFRDSSFDFGYAAGESVYVALGLKALIVGSGKGILALSKGVNKSLLTATNSVKNSVTSENVLTALRNTSLIVEPTEVLSMLNNRWWAKCLYRKKAWSNQLTDELTTLVNEFKFSFKEFGPKLVDFGPTRLGKYFDETMEGIIRAGWESGTFTGLSDEVAQALNSLKSEYDLLIKPKVSINGRTPEPDLLFIKRNSNGTLNYDDAIFIDNKYHIETKFTGAQQEIATAVKSPSGQANVITTNSFTTISGKVIPNNITIKVKEVRVFSIDDFANLIVKTF